MRLCNLQDSCLLRPSRGYLGNLTRTALQSQDLRKTHELFSQKNCAMMNESGPGGEVGEREKSWETGFGVWWEKRRVWNRKSGESEGVKRKWRCLRVSLEGLRRHVWETIASAFFFFWVWKFAFDLVCLFLF